MMGAATLDNPNRNYSKPYIPNRPTPKPEVEPRHIYTGQTHTYNINNKLIKAPNKKAALKLYQKLYAHELPKTKKNKKK